MVTVGIFPFKENSHGIAGNRTRVLMISSQRLWPLDHEAGQYRNITYWKIDKSSAFNGSVNYIIFFLSWACFVSFILYKCTKILYCTYGTSEHSHVTLTRENYVQPESTYLPYRTSLQVRNTRSLHIALTLIVLMWRVGWAHNNARKYRIGRWDVFVTVHPWCNYINNQLDATITVY